MLVHIHQSLTASTYSINRNGLKRKKRAGSVLPQWDLQIFVNYSILVDTGVRFVLITRCSAVYCRIGEANEVFLRSLLPPEN